MPLRKPMPEQIVEEVFRRKKKDRKTDKTRRLLREWLMENRVCVHGCGTVLNCQGCFDLLLEEASRHANYKPFNEGVYLAKCNPADKGVIGMSLDFKQRKVAYLKELVAHKSRYPGLQADWDKWSPTHGDAWGQTLTWHEIFHSDLSMSIPQILEVETKLIKQYETDNPDKGYNKCSSYGEASRQSWTPEKKARHGRRQVQKQEDRVRLAELASELLKTGAPKNGQNLFED